MPYNSDPNVQQVAALIANSPKLQAEYFSKLLEKTAEQHNAFEAFTSPPAKNGTFRGIRSIFAKKKDLAVGGGRTVNFNTIGTPGGRGVRGVEELQGSESVAPMGTYDCTVDWFRDAVNLDKDTIEHLSAGKSLRSTLNDMLGEKMGIQKQHDMMMRLIHGAQTNVFRPNNRASVNDLVSTDTLSLENAIAARARLTTLGAMPIMHKVSATGSHVDGFLMFASQFGMLPIRNNDSYQTAVANGAIRGEGNNNFSGVLTNWQGMPWYEHKVINQPWDDYIGSPMQPQARLGVAFGVDSAIGACKLITNAANTKEHYFQFFSGFRYKFSRLELAAADNTQKYAWIINPNGSVGFVGYLGNGNNGNQITLNKILSPDGAGTSTLGVTTLGDLAVNTTPTPDVWTGGNAKLPVTSGGITWTYTDEFAADAMIIEANAKGVPIGRSFVFGAMAACFASGRIDMNMIGQKHDYGFIDGNGYEMIYGTCVTKNAANKPTGYLRVDHALEYEGYPVPVML
jgi:hypothetical protein